MFAARNDHAAVVEALLDGGVDLDTQKNVRIDLVHLSWVHFAINCSLCPPPHPCPHLVVWPLLRRLAAAAANSQTLTAARQPASSCAQLASSFASWWHTARARHRHHRRLPTPTHVGMAGHHGSPHSVLPPPPLQPPSSAATSPSMPVHPTARNSCALQSSLP